MLLDSHQYKASRLEVTPWPPAFSLPSPCSTHVIASGCRWTVPLLNSWEESLARSPRTAGRMTDGGKLNWQLKKPEGFQGLCYRVTPEGRKCGKMGSWKVAPHTSKHFHNADAEEGVRDAEGDK